MLAPSAVHAMDVIGHPSSYTLTGCFGPSFASLPHANRAVVTAGVATMCVFGAGDPGRVSLMRVSPCVKALRLDMIQRGERN